MSSKVAVPSSAVATKNTKDNFAKIKEGMTKAEAVAFLGEPTGSEVIGQIYETEIKGPICEGSGFKIVTRFPSFGVNPLCRASGFKLLTKLYFRYFLIPE